MSWDKTGISDFASRITTHVRHFARPLGRLSERKTLVRHCVAFSCVFLVIFFSIYTAWALDEPQDSWVGYVYEADSTPKCDLSTSSQGERMLAINIRKGPLSYTQARAIQISWDLVIGQGGRLLHTWLLLRTLSDACVFLLERHGIPHDLYTALAITSSDFGIIISSARILTRKRNWQVIITATWALLSLTHALLFPVLWSGATGYLNPSANYCKGPSSELVECEKIKPCFQVIDGSRIGLEDNVVVLIESDPGMNISQCTCLPLMSTVLF